MELYFQNLKKHLNSQFHRKSFPQGKKRQSFSFTDVVDIENAIPVGTYEITGLDFQEKILDASWLLVQISSLAQLFQ